MTFEEAYKKTGRVFCVTLSATSKKAPPVLINYITAPNVVIASAVLASAAVPGFVDAMRLKVKDENGVIRDQTKNSEEYRDGSIDSVSTWSLDIHDQNWEVLISNCQFKQRFDWDGGFESKRCRGFGYHSIWGGLNGTGVYCFFIGIFFLFSCIVYPQLALDTLNAAFFHSLMPLVTIPTSFYRIYQPPVYLRC